MKELAQQNPNDLNNFNNPSTDENNQYKKPDSFPYSSDNFNKLPEKIDPSNLNHIDDNALINKPKGKFQSDTNLNSVVKKCENNDLIIYRPEKQYTSQQNGKEGRNNIYTGIKVGYSGEKYEGQLLEETYHGIGKLISIKKDECYIGEFYYGKRNGIGYMKDYKNDSFYKGYFVKDVKNGFGNLISNSGKRSIKSRFLNGVADDFAIIEEKNQNSYYRYKGDLKDGLFEGNGQEDSMNGTYIGEFSNGFREGVGSYKDANETLKYLGEWSKDARHGFGEEIYNDSGDFYRGQYKANQKTGSGYYYHKKQQLAFVGDFSQGERNGCGRLEGKKFIYFGCWKDDMIHGMGYIKQNERTYFGNFENNLRSGLGYESNQQYCYKGYWNLDKPHGWGVLKVYKNAEQPDTELDKVNSNINNSYDDPGLLKGSSRFIKNKYPSSYSISGNNPKVSYENERPKSPVKTGKRIVKQQAYDPTFLTGCEHKENTTTNLNNRRPSLYENKTGYNPITNQSYDSTHPLSTKYSKDLFTSVSSLSPQKSPTKKNESPYKNTSVSNLQEDLNYNSIQNFDDHSSKPNCTYLGMQYHHGKLIEVTEDQKAINPIINALDDVNLSQFTQIVFNNVNQVSKHIASKIPYIEEKFETSVLKLDNKECEINSKLQENEVKFDNLGTSQNHVLDSFKCQMLNEGNDVNKILEDANNLQNDLPYKINSKPEKERNDISNSMSDKELEQLKKIDELETDLYGQDSTKQPQKNQDSVKNQPDDLFISFLEQDPNQKNVFDEIKEKPESNKPNGNNTKRKFSSKDGKNEYESEYETPKLLGNDPICWNSKAKQAFYNSSHNNNLLKNDNLFNKKPSNVPVPNISPVRDSPTFKGSIIKESDISFENSNTNKNSLSLNETECKKYWSLSSKGDSNINHASPKNNAKDDPFLMEDNFQSFNFDKGEFVWQDLEKSIVKKYLKKKSSSQRNLSKSVSQKNSVGELDFPKEDSIFDLDIEDSIKFNEDLRYKKKKMRDTDDEKYQVDRPTFNYDNAMNDSERKGSKDIDIHLQESIIFESNKSDKDNGDKPNFDVIEHPIGLKFDSEHFKSNRYSSEEVNESSNKDGSNQNIFESLKNEDNKVEQPVSNNQPQNLEFLNSSDDTKEKVESKTEDLNDQESEKEPPKAEEYQKSEVFEDNISEEVEPKPEEAELIKQSSEKDIDPKEEQKEPEEIKVPSLQDLSEESIKQPENVEDPPIIEKEPENVEEPPIIEKEPEHVEEPIQEPPIIEEQPKQEDKPEEVKKGILLNKSDDNINATQNNTTDDNLESPEKKDLPSSRSKKSNGAKKVQFPENIKDNEGRPKTLKRTQVPVKKLDFHNLLKLKNLISAKKAKLQSPDKNESLTNQAPDTVSELSPESKKQTPTKGRSNQDKKFSKQIATLKNNTPTKSPLFTKSDKKPEIEKILPENPINESFSPQKTENNENLSEEDSKSNIVFPEKKLELEIQSPQSTKRKSLRTIDKKRSSRSIENSFNLNDTEFKKESARKIKTELGDVLKNFDLDSDQKKPDVEKSVTPKKKILSQETAQALFGIQPESKRDAPVNKYTNKGPDEKIKDSVNVTNIMAGFLANHEKDNSKKKPIQNTKEIEKIIPKNSTRNIAQKIIDNKDQKIDKPNILPKDIENIGISARNIAKNFAQPKQETPTNQPNIENKNEKPNILPKDIENIGISARNIAKNFAQPKQENPTNQPNKEPKKKLAASEVFPKNNEKKEEPKKKIIQNHLYSSPTLT